MFFYIDKLSVDNGLQYIRDRLSMPFLVNAEPVPVDSLHQSAENMLASLGSETVPTVPDSDFPQLTSEQKTRLKIVTRCAAKRLEQESPMLIGETVEEDSFTYLSDEWRSAPAGSGVLRRTTNKAVIYYLFPNVRVANGDITETFPTDPEQPADRMLKRDISSVLLKFSKSALKMAGGAAVEAIGSALGSMIFNLVLKEVFGIDDQAELVSKIKTAVGVEVRSAKIDTIEGNINGVFMHIMNSYIPARRKADLTNREDREELMDKLKWVYRDLIIHVIGVLGQTNYAEQGLPLYITAATLHILILQEQALVDPKYTDPNQSTYADSLQSFARDYANHIETTFKAIYSARGNQVRAFSDTFVDGSVYQPGARWVDEDKVNGYRSGRYSGVTKENGENVGPMTRAQRDANEHRAQVLAALTQDYGDPLKTVVPALRRLEEKAIRIIS